MAPHRQTKVAQPAIPALAVKYGFVTRVLHGRFDDTSSIDVNNTLAPGFQFYTSLGASRPAAPPGSFTTSDSVLTCSNPSGNNPVICTIGYLGTSAPRTVGTTYPFASYTEILLKFVGSGSSFWAMDVTGILQQIDGGQGSGAEIDYWETDFGASIHNWTANTTHNIIGSGGIDFSFFRKLGILCVPGALNSGTCFVALYVDDVLQATFNATAFGGGYQTVLENSSYFLRVGAKAGSTCQIKYIDRWQ